MARPVWYRAGVVLALFALSPRLIAAEGRWIKITAPEYTLITSLSDSQALAWGSNFSQFIAALQGFTPIHPSRLPRLTVVVFARERDFKRFQPQREDGTTAEVAGYFSRRESWAVAALAGSAMKEQNRRIIFHEGTHWFLSGFELPNPVWLEEGLAEVFSTFAIEGKFIHFGRPIETHVEVLRMLPNLPLEHLLFLPHDSLHTGDEFGAFRTGMTYAQSWAFVHYLLFGQRQVPKGALREYLMRLRTMHPDQAFQSAFGGSYAEIDAQLRDYLRSGRYYVAKQPLAAVPSLKPEPATAAEVEDALTRLYLVSGRVAEATANAERLVTASPEDPRAYELQGEVAQASGDTDLARAAYRQAINLGSRDFRPYFETARSLQSEMGRAGGTAASDAERARRIANLHEHAINHRPTYRPAYQGLAGIVAAVPPGNPEDATFLAAGLKLFPKDGLIRLGLAVIAHRDGDRERARTLVDDVLSSATDQPEAMAYARRLDASWSRRETSDQVAELAKAKDYAGAVALLDAQMKSGGSIEQRLLWKKQRDELQAAHWMQEGRKAQAERRWADARQAYTDALNMSYSPSIKQQARQQLERIEKIERSQP